MIIMEKVLACFFYSAAASVVIAVTVGIIAIYHAERQMRRQNPK